MHHAVIRFVDGQTGSWAQGKLEPVIPDLVDKGEQPFIKPFMVSMADDHYALDIRRARDLLGWEPKHRLRDELPGMVAALKDDPIGWYEVNGVSPPGWFAAAGKLGENPEELMASFFSYAQRWHYPGVRSGRAGFVRVSAP